MVGGLTGDAWAARWGHLIREVPDFPSPGILFRDITPVLHDIEALRAATSERTVAVMLEPLQGEGGVNVPSPGYLRAVREWCDEQGLLLILDEVQTGVGRTGTLFACEREDVTPDLLCLGKSLSGGYLPMAATLSTPEIYRAFLGAYQQGRMLHNGHTFGGNPLGAAVARAALSVLVEEKMIENSATLGDYFLERLRAIDSHWIKEVRGRGLWIGLELTKAAGGARRFCEALMARGLLCKETHEHVIRFTPPLIIQKEDIDWALERIEEVLTTQPPAD